MPLIINADDFGLSESSDNTILMLHRLGVVSSTTIMANGGNFHHAVESLKETPKLGTGVHLCLDGPYNVGNKYTTIIDNQTNQFFGFHEIIPKLSRFLADESEIYREYCLQIEKVMDHKIKISHLDHHHHLHIYLPVLNSMIKAAKKYKIKYIRPQKMFLYQNTNYFKHIYRNFHHLYLKSRIRTIDGFYSPSIIYNSHYEQHFERLAYLVKIKNKTIEIMLHPIDKSNPETVFFSSPAVVSLLAGCKIIRYCDLI
jgi:predicted glycoside hydrolase/deacetylase ChbG (UPF0249 family)